MSGIRSVDSLVEPAVAETLENLDLQPEDKAAARLAQRYAAAIDRAYYIARDAEKIDLSNEDEDIVARVNALRNRVNAQTVLENLGPKLHALLNELTATPKARAATGKNPAPPGPDRLSKFRQARGA